MEILWDFDQTHNLLFIRPKLAEQLRQLRYEMFGEGVLIRL